MAKSKYGKYFLTDAKTPSTGTQAAAEYAKWATRMTWLDGKVIEGAFHFGCSWYYQAPEKALPAHTHDFDEILGFYGSDPQNPRDLGGEVEFWMEDEKHVLTESFLVFIPAGMKHCPLKINRIDRPMFHLGAAPSHDYVKKAAE
jgi:quercetin dioxygenase-like cupin family protein